MSSSDDKGLVPDDDETARRLVEYSDEKLAKLWFTNGALLVVARCSDKHDRENNIFERTNRLVKEEARRRGLKLKGKLN